jgi:hypothetical protein
VWKCGVNLVEIGVSSSGVKGVKPDVFFVVDEDTLSIWGLQVRSDAFECSVINELVVDVSLKVVGFVCYDLVGVGDEGHFSFVG